MRFSSNMDKHQKIDDRREIVQNEKDIMDNFDIDDPVPYELANELPDDIQEQPRDGMPQNEGENRPAPLNVAQKVAEGLKEHGSLRGACLKVCNSKLLICNPYKKKVNMIKTMEQRLMILIL